MLLIVPGLFAGRGRALLMTISVGLLLNGPIANLNTNIQQVTKSFICMYEQMKVLACRYKTTYSGMFENVISNMEKIHKETEQRLTECAETVAGEAANEAKKIQKENEEFVSKIKEEIDDNKRKARGVGDTACHAGFILGTVFTFLFNPLAGGAHIGACIAKDKMQSAIASMPDVSMDELPKQNLDRLISWAKDLYSNIDPLEINKKSIGDMLQTRSTASIREKLIQSTQRFFDGLKFIFANIKVVFYSLSLMYMLYQANQYLTKYLSDDTYDNMFVNESLDEGYAEKLLPLRRWESKEKYQMTSTKKCWKLSTQEFKSIGLRIIPPLLFFLATIAIIVGDHLFASFIDVLKKNGKFGITFNGMEQGVRLNGLLDEAANGEVPMLNLNLAAFDLSTDPCLPKPVKTNWVQLVPLIALVIISLVSCFIESYIQRLRSQICNLFYPER